jgi:hypothetical protein
MTVTPDLDGIDDDLCAISEKTYCEMDKANIQKWTGTAK